MKPAYRIPSVGIEEEYQLVDQDSGELVPTGRSVLKEVRHKVSSDIQHELHLEQIEMASPILSNSADIEACLTETRKKIAEAAMGSHSRLVAAGTHPMRLSGPPHITPIARYRIMAEKFQAIAKELMIFGFHIHVDMPDREIGVGVINRMRQWMPLLQAMSANSPYWNGHDTGYASFRRELWSQWPLAGVPAPFQDYTDYQACIDELVVSNAIDDPSKIYWDMRLPHKLPTIEIRVCDVMTDVSQVVSLAAIMRALVMQSEQDIHSNRATINPRPELLKAAMWQAARFGLSGTLIDLHVKTQVGASQALDHLMSYVHDALTALGDIEQVASYIEYLKQNGSPAEYQRRCFEKLNGNLNQLVKHLAASTASASND